MSNPFRVIPVVAAFCLAIPLSAQEPVRSITFAGKPAPVSLNLDKGGPFVEGRINGQPVRLSVVPEYDFSQLDKKSAERLGLKTLAGYDEVVLTPSLSVAGAELKNEPWILIDWPPDACHIDGVIGHSTLREFAVHLDYLRGQMTLMKPDALPALLPNEGVVEMDLQESDISFSGTNVSARRGGLTLLAQAGEGVKVPLKLASSLRGRPTLPETLMKKDLPALPQRPGSIVKPELKLGSYNFRGIEFLVTAQGMPEYPDNFGLLPEDVMRCLDLTLDYAGHKVRAGTNMMPVYSVNSAGITVEQTESGEWRITGITEKSAAFRAGIQKEDVLVAIGATPCAKASLSKIMDLFGREDRRTDRRATFLRRSPAEVTQEIILTWTASD